MLVEARINPLKQRVQADSRPKGRQAVRSGDRFWGRTRPAACLVRQRRSRSGHEATYRCSASVPGSAGYSPTRSPPSSTTSIASQPRKLAGYTGLCPRIYQSGERDLRGPIAKQGPRCLGWALVEAATHACTRPLPRPLPPNESPHWQTARRQGRANRPRPPTHRGDLHMLTRTNPSLNWKAGRTWSDLGGD